MHITHWSKFVRTRCFIGRFAAWLASQHMCSVHFPSKVTTIRHVLALALAGLPFHAQAGANVGEDKAQLCMLCHKVAPDRRFVPLLEQQPVEYLVAATIAFKAQQRVETSMTVNAANLSDIDIRDIAAYFAFKGFPKYAQNLEASKVAAGEKIVAEMNCASCHAGNYSGAGMVPRLAGQKVMYLVGQMEAFRDGRRILPAGMRVPKDRADIEGVASYLASLP